MDWLLLLKILGLLIGSIWTVVKLISWWNQEKPKVRIVCLRPEDDRHRHRCFKVCLSNRAKFPVRITEGYFAWRSPTITAPWLRSSQRAEFLRAVFHGRGNIMFTPGEIPGYIAGYSDTQTYVHYPTASDLVAGSGLRRWVATKSLHLIFESALGERFRIKPPKKWYKEALQEPDGAEKPGGD